MKIGRIATNWDQSFLMQVKGRKIFKGVINNFWPLMGVSKKIIIVTRGL